MGSGLEMSLAWLSVAAVALMIPSHLVIHKVSSEDCYGEDKQGCYAIFPRAPEGNV